MDSGAVWIVLLSFESIEFDEIGHSSFGLSDVAGALASDESIFVIFSLFDFVDSDASSSSSE